VTKERRLLFLFEERKRWNSSSREREMRWTYFFVSLLFESWLLWQEKAKQVFRFMISVGVVMHQKRRKRNNGYRDTAVMRPSPKEEKSLER
jgi:hypothetical protein